MSTFVSFFKEAICLFTVVGLYCRTGTNVKNILIFQKIITYFLDYSKLFKSNKP